MQNFQELQAFMQIAKFIPRKRNESIQIRSTSTTGPLKNTFSRKIISLSWLFVKLPNLPPKKD